MSVSRAPYFTTIITFGCKVNAIFFNLQRFSVLFKTLTFVLLWRTSALISTTNYYGTLLHITSSFHFSRNLNVNSQR